MFLFIINCLMNRDIIALKEKMHKPLLFFLMCVLTFPDFCDSLSVLDEIIHFTHMFQRRGML